MKIPAAMARNGRTTPRTLRAGISVTKPQRMSQMANKSIPIFLVNLLMEVISFLHDLCKGRNKCFP
jgi:hypothetical protein